jgi:hypothetical protein
MNAVLDDDFEKKMTVVGLMKKYAENRDVDTFAKALSILLVHPKHHILIKDISSAASSPERLGRFQPNLAHMCRLPPKLL